MGRGPLPDDRLRFTGYDLGSAKRDNYDDRSIRPEYDQEYEEEEGNYDEEGEWQVALKEKEDELVDRALRRIQRARLKGEAEVDLSRDEIDALERRKNMQQVVVRKSSKDQGKQQPTNKKSQGKKKGTGGFLGLGGPAPKQKTPKGSPKQLPAPEDRTHSGRNSPDPYGQDPRGVIVPAGYTPQAVSRQSAAPRASRASPRPNSGSRQQPSPPSSYYGFDPRFHNPGDPYVRPVSSSSRNSETRSLPDDPDWHPRSRSSSSAQLYAQGVDPMAYETGRRNISGPPTVSYSTLRRAPPPPNPRAGPSSPEPPAVLRSSSGLSNEVVEISSDEEDEDESDEGVRVDPAYGPSGYSMSPRAPRPRRGGRR